MGKERKKLDDNQPPTLTWGGMIFLCIVMFGLLFTISH